MSSSILPVKRLANRRQFLVACGLMVSTILLASKSQANALNCSEAFYLRGSLIARYTAPDSELLTANQIIKIYGVKASRAQEFRRRFDSEVINNFAWAQAGNPRLSITGQSLVVDMYRLKRWDLSDEEKSALIDGRRSVPGFIEFKHLLFSDIVFRI